MLGFELDFWDYTTFAVLMILAISGLGFLVWMMGLPGRIAIARKHPDAEAINVMGYAGFLPLVPWIQAFIWAFKPTDTIDIRRFPEAEAKAIEEDIARLSGKSPKKEPPPAKLEKTTDPVEPAKLVKPVKPVEDPQSGPDENKQS